VFTFDQFILHGKIASYVASDNYQAGWDNGTYIASLFPKNQELKIVIFEYPIVSAVISRVDGFFDALRNQNRKFVVVKRYIAVDPQTGKEQANRFLTDFPKKKSVDVIFSVNDGAGLQIVKMLWEKGRREITHASVDGDPESIENIKNKRLTVIDSAQFCGEMGRETARHLISYLNGQSAVEKKLIPTFPITENTLEEFHGWMGAPVRPPKEFTEAGIQNKLPLKIHSYAARSAVRIGMASHCPYLCEQGPGQWGGYVYDILKDIASDNHLKLEIIGIENRRLNKALKNKKVQYIVIPSYFVRYSPDVYIAPPKLGASYTGALFTPGVKMQIVDKESLFDKRIAFAKLGQESDLNLDPEEFKKSVKIEGADVADRMIKALSERRVDLALGDYNVLRYTSLRRQQLHLEIQPTSLTGFNTLSLVSNTDDPDYANLPTLLQKWFSVNRENGKLARILKKYNLTDWVLFDR
ncbi:MAG: substrate-binding domain-containing protein, partial [Bdellovibrio sp.]